MMLGVDRLANLERQGKATPRIGTDMRNPIRHPGRRQRWAIPANEVGRKVKSAFSIRTLAGLGTASSHESRPDIVAAVEAAASAIGWDLTCEETLVTGPFPYYNRLCSPAGRPDLVFGADLIFDHAGGPNAGIQLALANSQDQGTDYTPPPKVIQAPELFQYANPTVTTPVPTKTSPPTPAHTAAPKSPATSNPAPQTQPAPTVQPGVVGAGAGTQNPVVTPTDGEWIPGISNTVLLLAAAGLGVLLLMKR